VYIAYHTFLQKELCRGKKQNKNSFSQYLKAKEGKYKNLHHYKFLFSRSQWGRKKNVVQTDIEHNEKKKMFAANFDRFLFAIFSIDRISTEAMRN
jgi:hypothetical protein